MKEQIKNNQDLIMLFARIYLFIKKYFIILIIFFIAGIVYGYYKNHASGYYFKKHLTINSIVVPKDISLDMVKSLQLLIDENNTPVLAQKLNIPEDAAASLIKIDTTTFHIRQNIGFIVDLSFRDSSYSDTITSGLVYFLNHNEYFQKHVKLFLREKQNILESINNKLGINDSTQEGSEPLYSSIQSQNILFFRSASSEQIRLMKERYETEKDLEFGSKISLVDETLVKVPAGIGLLKSVILYGLGIGILGIVLSLFIESLCLTRNYLRQQKG